MDLRAAPGGGRACVAARICLDADGDGAGIGRACAAPDCDDADPTVLPGATELCNGVDDDCDGVVDQELRNACGRCGPLPAESCNGVDDDCDGEVDELVRNACGGCGPTPADACNGLDDDCDGVTDEGCGGCLEGATLPCYGGPPGSDGIGLCHAGVQLCTGGAYGSCLDQVLPAEERCDGADDDCDGVADNGSLNSCGGCGPAPAESCNGADDDCDGLVDEGVTTLCGGCTPCGEALLFPSEVGTTGAGVAPAPDGGVTLGTGELNANFIWVPNSDEDTVSRWDTRTGRELARYWIGENPSRTTVDLDGNAWVANRGDGTVSHLFLDHGDCVDRNGDGVLQTSRDLNGDGRITGGELVSSAGAPLADECLHCQVRIGQATDWVRGAGIDRDNYAWFGTWNSRELYKIDPVTCQIVLRLPLQDSVYGISIDGTGTLWTSKLAEACINKVDTATGTLLQRICPNPNFTLYGIAVDAAGSVWYGDTGSSVRRFEPATSTWTTFAEPTAALRYTAGIVAATDGTIWVAGYDSHHLGQLDPATGAWNLVQTYTGLPAGMIRCANPRGVTFDSDGNLWAICRGSGSLLKLTAAGVPIAGYSIVEAARPTVGTSPYSYSDNTGFQLFNYTATEGTWTDRFDAGAQVTFSRLTYVAYLPQDTSVEVRVRAAPTTEALELATFSAWTAGTDLDLRALVTGPARYLDIEAVLRTTNGSHRPVLRDLRVFFETDDCRVAATPCPSGQLCEPVHGGCIVVPIQCVEDGACASGEYCDPTGICRAGCRTLPDSCAAGERCDAVERRCETRVAECLTDSGCEAGSWCSPSEYCEPGCRVAPDDCPPRTRCDAITRGCNPLPPDCALDTDCETDEFCDGSGRCVTGCRLSPDSCGAGLRCGGGLHECLPAPPACDPLTATAELCNGADDDCDGEVDEEDPALGVTCTVGTAASGMTVCHEGLLLCRADPSPDPAVAVLLQGTVTNALLPAGPYESRADVTLDRVIRGQSGATLATGDGLVHTLSVRSTADVVLQGVTVTGLSLRMLSGGRLRLDDSLVAGLPGGAGVLDAWTCSSFRVLRTTLRDLALLTGQSCPTEISLSRLEATDRVVRTLGTFRGPLTFTDSEVLGLNLVPRVQAGIVLEWSGSSVVQGSVFSRLTTALRFASVGPHEARGNLLQDSNIGLDVALTAFPTFEDNTVDLRDVGHVALGVRFDNLRPGGGGTLRRTAFLLEPQDKAFQLEPDQFQVATPSVIEGSTFAGAPVAGQYRLAGEGEGGTIEVGLVDQAVDYTVYPWASVYFQSISAAAIRDVTLRSEFPDANGQLVSRWGSALTLERVVLQDLQLFVDTGATANMTSCDVSIASTAWRYLVRNVGTLTVTGSAFSWEPALPADLPRHGAIESWNAGIVAISASTFDRLEWAVVNRDTSRSTMSNCTFTDNKNSIYGQHQAQLGPITGMTITDSRADVASVGFYLDFGEGGRATVDGTVFDLGPEDIPYLLDLDAFHAATPSSFTGTTYLDGEDGLGTTLQGDVRTGSVRIEPVEGSSTLHTRDLWVSAGSSATVGSGITLLGDAPGAGPGITVRDAGSSLTFEAGTTIRDARVGVWTGAFATFLGTSFEATTSQNVDYLAVDGTATLTGCSFTDAFRTRQAITLGNDGRVQVTGSTFTGLEWGVLGRTRSGATVDGCTFDNVAQPLYIEDAADLTATANLIRDTDPLLASVGIESRLATLGGLTLSVSGTSFDLGATDAPFRFSIDSFRSDNSVAVSGSTFAAGELGVGYLLRDSLNAGNATLAHVEPAQPSFNLATSVHVRNTSTLTVPAGTVLASSSTTFHELRLWETAAGTIGAVTFDDVGFHASASSTATVTGATFSADEGWYTNLLAIGTPGAVTVDGCSFFRPVPTSVRLRGVYVYGGLTVAPTIQGSTFTDLDTGIYVERDPVPVLAGNTFAGCRLDTYEVP